MPEAPPVNFRQFCYGESETITAWGVAGSYSAVAYTRAGFVGGVEGNAELDGGAVAGAGVGVGHFGEVAGRGGAEMAGGES